MSLPFYCLHALQDAIDSTILARGQAVQRVVLIQLHSLHCSLCTAYHQKNAYYVLHRVCTVRKTRQRKHEPVRRAFRRRCGCARSIFATSAAYPAVQLALKSHDPARQGGARLQLAQRTTCAFLRWAKQKHSSSTSHSTLAACKDKLGHLLLNHSSAESRHDMSDCCPEH